MLRNDFEANLRRLTLGFRCSKDELKQIAEQAAENNSRMKKFMELFFIAESSTQAQAARALRMVGEHRPACLQPYKALLIQEVAPIDHWIVRASFCTVVPKLNLTAREIHQVIEILMDYLNDESSVVKTCVMQALADLIFLDPGLRDDILPIIESLTHTGTAAMRARGRQLQKKFYKTEHRRRPNVRDS
jgi:hypothetical protein